MDINENFILNSKIESNIKKKLIIYNYIILLTFKKMQKCIIKL